MNLLGGTCLHTNPNKMWLKQASNKKYHIRFNGEDHLLSERQVGDLIKKQLTNVKSVCRMFETFGVSLDRLKDLSISILPLDKKYAETDGEVMKLNESLFKDGDFFENYFFVVAHEIIHWLSRVKEQDGYLHDPEEVLGFTMSVAYELERGGDVESVWAKVYPKIRWHFNDEADSKDFFSKMIDKAKGMLNA